MNTPSLPPIKKILIFANLASFKLKTEREASKIKVQLTLRPLPNNTNTKVTTYLHINVTCVVLISVKSNRDSIIKLLPVL